MALALLGSACGAGSGSADSVSPLALPFTVAATVWPGTLASQWTAQNAQGPIRFAVGNSDLDLHSALWPSDAGGVLKLPLGAGPHTLYAQSRQDDGSWSPLAQASASGTAVRMDAGGGVGFSCFLGPDGKIFCLGLNDRGQLGVGDSLSRGLGTAPAQAAAAVILPAGTTAVALAVGGAHACLLDQKGGVRCWGDNLFGQLGVASGDSRGTTTQDVGDGLLEVALPDPAVQIAAGGTLTVASLASGTAVAWGGAIGRGKVVALQLPSQAAVVDLVAGDAHACLLMADGTVACLGANGAGQLGTGDILPRQPAAALTAVNLGSGRQAIMLRAGGAQTCAVLNNLQLKCWGRTAGATAELSTADSLAAVPLGDNHYPLDVAVGAGHLCVLRDDQQVFCYGLNDQGQLGQGSQADAVYPSLDAGGKLSPPAAVDFGSEAPLPRGVIAGASHSCVLLADGSRRCWGGNQFGQLGLGDTVARGRASTDMGAALLAVQLP